MVAEAEAQARRLLSFGPPPRGVTHGLEIIGVRRALKDLAAALSAAGLEDMDRLQLLGDTLRAMYEPALAATGEAEPAIEEGVPPAAEEGGSTATAGGGGLVMQLVEAPRKLAIPARAWSCTSLEQLHHK